MSNSNLPYNRTDQAELRRLRLAIIRQFSLSDLRTLCFDLGIDYDDLSGDTKSGKAIELIESMVRRGRLKELVDAVEAGPRIQPPHIALYHRISTFFSKETDFQQARRNRQILMQRVRTIWIKGVLQNLLHNVVKLELDLAVKIGAVEQPPPMRLAGLKKAESSVMSSTSLTEKFYDFGGHLLILGGPGSGKTVTLLELAEELLSIAEEDKDEPIPLIFNLSTWSQERLKLEDWLVEELQHIYMVDNKFGRAWLEDEPFLLLLDGLDEVPETYRDECVKAINSFRQRHSLTNVVVSSRVEDYERLKVKLQLHGALVIQPLTSQHIEIYVDRANLLQPIEQALKNDTTFQEMLRTPLMLNIMTLAIRSLTATELQSLETPDAYRYYLFNAYIKSMFERRQLKPEYTQEQVIVWMRWIACRMLQNSQTVFSSKRLQATWLTTNAQKRTYNLIFKLTIGLVGLLNALLIIGLMSLPVGLLIWYIFFALEAGVSFGSFVWFFAAILGTAGFSRRWGTQPQKAVERRKRIDISWFQGIKKVFWRSLGVAFGILINGLIGGIIVAKLGIPLFDAFIMLGDLIVKRSRNWIQPRIVQMLLVRDESIPAELETLLDEMVDFTFLRKVGDDYMFIHQRILEHFGKLKNNEILPSST